MRHCSSVALFPIAEQERLQDAIPHAEFIGYPGVGHSNQWEQPDRVAADIVRFVKRVTPHGTGD